MRIISILLKKDINERITSIKNTKKDIMGVILSAFLSLFVIGVFIFTFSFFTQTYAYIKVGYVTTTTQRVFEILTIFYLLLFLLLMFVGISKLNKNLIDVGNLTLLSMPITPFQIFVSKLFGVYLNLSITSVLISLPTFLMLIIEGLLSWPIIFVGFAL